MPRLINRPGHFNLEYIDIIRHPLAGNSEIHNRGAALGATEILANYGISSESDQIPQSVIHEGKRCFINFLAVSLYASRDPSLDILLDVFKLEGGKHQSSIAGVRARTTIQNAALANGYLGHLEDYDDTHFPTVIHPSSPPLPSS